MKHQDLLAHNRAAWDGYAKSGIRWAEPVGPETIARARRGAWEVILTPNRPAPREWFGAVMGPGGLEGRDVLCLASAGGQQAPVLAAAGARVTSFDLSDEMLSRDRETAEREGLDLKTVQGDMTDLKVLEDKMFELIFNPVSNVFVQDVEAVWRECARVLRPGGRLLAGFMNPAYYLFDHDEAAGTGEDTVRFRLPYADLTHRDAAWLALARSKREALEFGHSLETQIGGQTRAGFAIVDLYEDTWDDASTPLNKWMPTMIATCAMKR